MSAQARARKNARKFGERNVVPIKVCTPHQILRYMLRGKGWEFMLAEFPNACFIFDEVHAYDPRIVGLTLASARLVTSWGARCLFLSATLPKFLEDLITQAIGPVTKIIPDKGKWRDLEVIERKRHTVEVRKGNVLENIDAIMASAKSHASTLIVCNHVRTAQDLFAMLTAAGL